MADDLQTLFGIPNPDQLPWTDRNAALAGGAGTTPLAGFDNPATPQQPVYQPSPAPSAGGTVGGGTPADSAPSGRTPVAARRRPRRGLGRYRWAMGQCRQGRPIRTCRVLCPSSTRQLVALQASREASVVPARLVLGQRGALVPSTLVFSRSCSRAVVPVRLLLRLVAAAYWAG
jgi:hypothetical protein